LNPYKVTIKNRDNPGPLKIISGKNPASCIEKNRPGPEFVQVAILRNLLLLSLQPSSQTGMKPRLQAAR